MKTSWKVIFSFFVATLTILGFLSFPYLDSVIQSCSGSFLCGGQIQKTLDYFDKSDSTAFALGQFFYQKLIIGAVVFLITLILSIITHQAYTRLLKK